MLAAPASCFSYCKTSHEFISHSKHPLSRAVPLDPTKQTPAPFIEANQRLTCIVYVRLKLVMPIGVYAASGSLGTRYRRVLEGVGGFDGYIQPRRANQSYNTVMLNLIVIQHQSFDVPVIYSHSLRVPLMAGPLCLAFFLFKRWAGRSIIKMYLSIV